MQTRTASPAVIRLSKGDRIFSIACNIILVLLMLLVLYPLVYIASASFSNSLAVVQGRVWLWPVEPTLEGYRAVLRSPAVPRGFVNSLYVMTVGTVINIVLTVMLAYPLSRKALYGRGLVMGIITFTMLFSGGLIPSFLLVRSVGFYNTYWALIIPKAVSVYNVIVARTFFQTNIPDDLYEAATLDGCSDARFLLRVVLPLSTPILAVLVMFYAVGHWNAYFDAMIYLRDPAMKTLQVVLRDILIANQTSTDMIKDVDAMAKQEGLALLLKYSLMVISSVPMLILYPFIQKHFVKGIMVGALKG
ncbi:MAG TPA: carbohydrate ABC transporter permease [Clostridia bacterium]|nr:carbohydrate ABC transporter permease [Clostridia bacterium]